MLMYFGLEWYICHGPAGLFYYTAGEWLQEKMCTYIYILLSFWYSSVVLQKVLSAATKELLMTKKER